MSWVEFVGPNHAVQIAGVKLVGINAENGRKLLFSLLFFAVVLIVSRFLRALSQRLLSSHRNQRIEFWLRQAIHLATATLILVGLVSIWFDDPTRLTTAVGLVTAGLAFALQKVVTSVAGYFVILRGKTFNVGDRIRMGGVRGDVISLSFIQTTIMEMGQPPSVQSDEPAMWVKSRQYTGRIVTVTNDKIFEEPVYNYTREFAYIWEEMSFPISYSDDFAQAEQIILRAAEQHTTQFETFSQEKLDEMRQHYAMSVAELHPRVYLRLTDNWIELTVRFTVDSHRVREVKDAMSREILAALNAAGIGIASGTYAIVQMPELRIARAPRANVAVAERSIRPTTIEPSQIEPSH
ncbi:MAG TPA: mechanosensitive ion channel family protein [Pirellulales bacterium]|nr:mechanosensitive ion channel family protein [Pirellulales bacterium]